MVYTIKNSFISVDIDTKGAQLMSVKDSAGTEYLWQGDPRYWEDRAINLFPVIGRMQDFVYRYKGTVYDMPLHGFLKDSELECLKNTGEEIVFSMCHNERTLEIYPFKFCLYIAYTLTDSTVNCKFTIENRGSDTLIYSFGGHPGFNVPLPGGGSFDDYYLEFCEAENPSLVQLNVDGLITGKTVPANLYGGSILKLEHGLFAHDALIFKGSGGKVSLKSAKGGSFVSMDYKDMPYLGVWQTSDSDAPFICLEPWLSLPSRDGVFEDLELKEGMDKLSPGQTGKTHFSFTIHAD